MKLKLLRSPLAAAGVCAALGWLGCAEGQDVIPGSLAGQEGTGGSSSGGGGSLGHGGVAGGNGGAAQGGSAQGGSAQGGSSQGGSGPGGSAQGGSAQGGASQGGSAQPGDASGADADGGVAGGGGRDASGDGNAGGSGTGGAPARDATVDRADASTLDARNDVPTDAVPDRVVEASADGALCSVGNTCSSCAEQRCPAQACALCQDMNGNGCAAACTAMLGCVVQHDGCATSTDPLCFAQCDAVINAQQGGTPPRDWTSSLIRCSCF